MNIVIYARYSSHSQTEQSIEGQLQACFEYAKPNGHVIAGEYIDRAQSGTTDSRTEFQRMITDSDKQFFEAVLVYQFDRFARNRYDSAINKAKRKKNGIRVISAKENITDGMPRIIDDGHNRKGIINIFDRAIYLWDNRRTIILNGGGKPIKIDNILPHKIEQNNAEFWVGSRLSGRTAPPRSPAGCGGSTCWGRLRRADEPCLPKRHAGLYPHPGGADDAVRRKRAGQAPALPRCPVGQERAGARTGRGGEEA